jgi:hypothetical protein
LLLNQKARAKGEISIGTLGRQPIPMPILLFSEDKFLEKQEAQRKLGKTSTEFNNVRTGENLNLISSPLYIPVRVS